MQYGFLGSGNFNSRSKLIFSHRGRRYSSSLSRRFPFKKKLVHVRVLAASGFLETRRVFFFFPSIFNRTNDLIGASRLSIEPTCLLSFMQIATAAIIDNNCRRSIAVSIASSDRIRPFASNKMHDFLSVFERLLTNPRIISRFFDVLFIIYEGTAGDSLSFFSQKFFFTSRY